VYVGELVLGQLLRVHLVYPSCRPIAVAIGRASPVTSAVRMPIAASAPMALMASGRSVSATDGSEQVSGARHEHLRHGIATGSEVLNGDAAVCQ
jgi:hypothetical protein